MKPRFPKRLLTAADLGVPDWWASDGCTRARNYSWTIGPCRRHDFDYWRGAIAAEAEEVRRDADRHLKAAINHNADYEQDGSQPKRWTRWKRWLTAIVYLRGTRRLGGPSFRVRPEGRLPVDDYKLLREVAEQEGRIQPE